MDRRTFLVGSGLLAAPVLTGVAVTSGAQPFGWGRDGFDVLADLARDDFEALVGATVTVRGGSGAATRHRVSAVDDAGAEPALQFAVRLSDDVGLAQDVYEVSHPDLGSVPLLLVPGEGTLEAFINRAVPR